MRRFTKPAVLACCALLLSACAGTSKKPPAEAAPATGATTAPQAAAPLDTAQAEKRFADAVQLMKQHKQRDAQDALAALAHDYPQFSGPLCNLGVLDVQSRKPGQAFDYFAKAVEARPDNAFAYGWLGILYRESGDYTHAEQAYLKALSIKPDDAVAQLNLAILYDAYLHRPQEALAHYREYQRLAGGDRLIVTAWINELQDGATGRPAAATSTSSGAPPVESKQ